MGHTTVVWLLHVLSQADHRLNQEVLSQADHRLNQEVLSGERPDDPLY